jgi:hypothetical protein
MRESEERTTEERDARSALPLEPELSEQWQVVRSVTERRNLASLARGISKLPADRARVVLETGAAIASLSFRACAEFLRAAPAAARLLDAPELRAWGEMGRRLAMGDAETGAAFFAAGVDNLAQLPAAARRLLLEICVKQMALSSSFALETFRQAPSIARAVADPDLLIAVLEVALEIAQRSAKHSAEFLSATPRTTENLREMGPDYEHIMRAAIGLAAAFVARAGGIAAEAWAAMPAALQGLDVERARALLERAGEFLERSGSAALHLLVAGGQVLRALPEIFDDWSHLLRAVAEKSNASLIAFLRATPAFVQALTDNARSRERARAGTSRGARAAEVARRVLAVTHEVARCDAEAALSCFKSSGRALRAVSIEQFEVWARDGLRPELGDARVRRSYYALETRQSHEALREGSAGLALDEVAHLLRLYIEALTGRAVEIAPLAAVPDESRIGDGRTIHLPAVVAEFADDALNFRLFKVLAAHAAGQIEFGTHAQDTADLQAAYHAIGELYAAENADARDAFALDGYINQMDRGEAALAPEEEARREAIARRRLPQGSDYRAVLALFPQRGLAARIFGTLENGRIDRHLRRAYRGLVRDLDLVREHLRRGRPRIADLPATLVPFELLFQITLCGGALDDARHHYGQIVSELETIVLDYLAGPEATVADTLMATSRVYALFQSVVPTESEQKNAEAPASDQDEGEDGQSAARETRDGASQADQQAHRTDARELFNAWASTDMTGDPDDLDAAENWSRAETPEQPLEAGEVAYMYDEWDRELADHRVGWCRVVEKRVQRGSPSFVEMTRERYRGTISSIRHQFQLMRPESLKRVANELDGDDYDLNAVIDYVMDRRATGHQSERIYTKRLRRERDVAVSFLLDQSSSTARTIGRHPLQPYTHPGRRIIEIEKEGLVLMSEALEAVGDVYAINGFTSEGRHNVKFYVVKDFDEPYSEEIARRIGGITYQNNTRLGAAVRHAAARLALQEARTRLLIVLSDGRPYDHDYGDARYAREDTREALRRAKLAGIIPFCITIDRDSEAELRDLYGEVGYTIIDDVLSLPERIPAIYRRLTT